MSTATGSGSFHGMTTHQIDMVQVARRVLQDNGFLTDMPPGLVATIPARDPDEGQKDLRALAWSSIDNEDSRALDQIAGPCGRGCLTQDPAL